MRPRFVVTGVAAGTVRLECGELPLHDFGIALVAFGALQVAAVVLRFIRQASVPVVCWRPRIRVVAQATVLCRIEMSRILAGCRRAVVAGRAGAKDLVVVHGSYRFPDVSAMAIFADIRRLNV